MGLLKANMLLAIFSTHLLIPFQTQTVKVSHLINAEINEYKKKYDYSENIANLLNGSPPSSTNQSYIRKAFHEKDKCDFTSQSSLCPILNVKNNKYQTKKGSNFDLDIKKVNAYKKVVRKGTQYSYSSFNHLQDICHEQIESLNVSHIKNTTINPDNEQEEDIVFKLQFSRSCALKIWEFVQEIEQIYDTKNLVNSHAIMLSEAIQSDNDQLLEDKLQSILLFFNQPSSKIDKIENDLNKQLSKLAMEYDDLKLKFYSLNQDYFNIIRGYNKNFDQISKQKKFSDSPIEIEMQLKQELLDIRQRVNRLESMECVSKSNLNATASTLNLERNSNNYMEKQTSAKQDILEIDYNHLFEERPSFKYSQ